MIPKTMTNNQPAPAQERVLRFLHEFRTQHGYAPSLRKIGAACGMNALQSVALCLGRLEKHGLIRIDRERKGQARSIAVTPAGLELLGVKTVELPEGVEYFRLGSPIAFNLVWGPKGSYTEEWPEVWERIA